MELKSMMIWAFRRNQTRALIHQVADTLSQVDKFNVVWRDAYTNVPFYTEWKGTHGLPDCIVELRELASWPILEKKDLILGRDKLVRKGVAKYHESVTGGSTGEPLHFRTMAGDALPSVTNFTIGRARMGIYPDTRMFLLWGHRHFYGQGWKSNLKFKIRQIKDWMTNHYRADATDLSPAALRADFSKICRFKPECIVAYSASLLALTRIVRRDLGSVSVRANLVPTLRSIICTAGPLTKEERAEISEFFGVPVGMEYGSMECGVMAYKTPVTGDRYVTFDTHLLHALAALGDSSNLPIVVTTLTTRYLPLIRYRIGDCISDPELDVGGNVVSFAEVTGRTGDCIEVSPGCAFHGYSLMVCAEENPKIIAYQLRVNKARRKVVFVAQTIQALTEKEKQQIVRHAADVAHMPTSVFEVEESLELIKAPSGKIRLVVEEA